MHLYRPHVVLTLLSPHLPPCYSYPVTSSHRGVYSFYSNSSSWLTLMEGEIHGVRTTTHSQGCALRYLIPPSQATLPQHPLAARTCLAPTQKSRARKKADPVETVETLSPKPGAERSVGDPSPPPPPQRRSLEDSGVCLQEKLTFFSQSANTYLQELHRDLTSKTHVRGKTQLRPPQCPNLQSPPPICLHSGMPRCRSFPVSATST